MHLNLLHLDNALKSQRDFMQACADLQARETDAQTEAAPVRLWGKEKSIEALRMKIASSLFHSDNATVVTFMGSGDFHHVSALLIGMVAQTNRDPFTIIHFDNHPDWVHCSSGIHCGSWVNRALALPPVAKVITIGVCSRDLVRPWMKGANLKAWKKGDIALMPWQSPSSRFRVLDIENIEEPEFLASLKALIPTRNVYITIDKDVLSHKDAITNWDQGKMPLARLLSTLRFILSNHHAIGIDVTGDYSPVHYAGRAFDVALKRLESLLDQPTRINTEIAAQINQSSNMALLNCIREAA